MEKKEIDVIERPKKVGRIENPDCHIIKYSNLYLIKPSNISLSKGVHNNNNEPANKAAVSIVAFCQERGSWDPFTEKEFLDFIDNNSDRFGDAKKRGLESWFYSFRQAEHYSDFLMFKKKGKWYITHEFVCECFKKSPSFKIVPENDQVRSSSDKEKYNCYSHECL